MINLEREFQHQKNDLGDIQRQECDALQNSHMEQLSQMQHLQQTEKLDLETKHSKATRQPDQQNSIVQIEVTYFQELAKLSESHKEADAQLRRASELAAREMVSRHQDSMRQLLLEQNERRAELLNENPMEVELINVGNANRGRRRGRGRRAGFAARLSYATKMAFINMYPYPSKRGPRGGGHRA